MSKKKAYDIFISYRREGGLDFARSIAYYLRIEGFQCFFDQRELKTGQFNQQIFEAIDNSKYFISVLTQGALDRCANTDDWVRKEIEHAIHKNVPIVPVAVRGEKLTFPETLPDSLLILKTTQASFIDRETDFEETIVKMVREQLRNLCDRSTRQHRKARRQAEKVFLKKASRFKGNDGVIDEQERLELERLASACGISRNRLEELVERVEAAAARRAKILNWAKRHILILALAGVAAVTILGLLLLGVSSRTSRVKGSQRVVAVGESEKDVLDVIDDSQRGKKDVTRSIESAAAELAMLDISRRNTAERDFRNSLRNNVRAGEMSRVDQIGQRIIDEYKAAAEEGRKLAALGMQSHELIKSRPDLVMKFVDIRTRVESDMKELIKCNRHEEALNYYNSARNVFQWLCMDTLERPSFSNEQ
jgi:hypothetical protein